MTRSRFLTRGAFRVATPAAFEWRPPLSSYQTILELWWRSRFHALVITVNPFPAFCNSVLFSKPDQQLLQVGNLLADGGSGKPPHLLEDSAVTGELAGYLDLVKDCSSPSKNEKNTSTAYPTRKAMARGETDSPPVNAKLNSPTTAPPIPAMRKRAQFAFDDGAKVSVLSSSSKLRKRNAQVPKRA